MILLLATSLSLAIRFAIIFCSPTRLNRTFTTLLNSLHFYPERYEERTQPAHLVLRAAWMRLTQMRQPTPLYLLVLPLLETLKHEILLAMNG